MQFHRRPYSGPPSHHLVIDMASEIEIGTSKRTIAVFSAGVALTATVLMATAGNTPALAIGFRLGSWFMNSAIGGWPRSRRLPRLVPLRW